MPKSSDDKGDSDDHSGNVNNNNSISNNNNSAPQGSWGGKVYPKVSSGDYNNVENRLGPHRKLVIQPKPDPIAATLNSEKAILGAAESIGALEEATVGDIAKHPDANKIGEAVDEAINTTPVDYLAPQKRTETFGFKLPNRNNMVMLMGQNRAPNAPHASAELHPKRLVVPHGREALYKTPLAERNVWAATERQGVKIDLLGTQQQQVDQNINNAAVAQPIKGWTFTRPANFAVWNLLRQCFGEQYFRNDNYRRIVTAMNENPRSAGTANWFLPKDFEGAVRKICLDRNPQFKDFREGHQREIVRKVAKEIILGVKYYSFKKLFDKYKVEVRGKHLFRRGRPFDTGEVAARAIAKGSSPGSFGATDAFDSRKRCIWVLLDNAPQYDPDNTLDEVTFFSHVGRHGRTHHSSLARGNGVLAAGEWIVEAGTITMINGLSGHYQPDLERLLYAIGVLHAAGGIGDDARVRLFKGREPVELTVEQALAHTAKELINEGLRAFRP